MRKRRVKQPVWMVCIAIGVGIGTLVALFVLPPEDIRSSSADGRMRLEGQGRFGSHVEITAAQEGGGTTSGSQLYRVALSGEVSVVPFVVTFTPSEQDLIQHPITDWYVHRWDDTAHAWQRLPTSTGIRKDTLETRATLSTQSTWKIDVVSDVQTPAFSQVLLEELLAAPAQQAVGYRAFTAHAPEGRDFVLVDASYDDGGCNGLYQEGSDQILTLQDRDIENGQFRVGVIWEIGEGCPEGRRISSSRR